jgi:hypothetical protein
LRLDKVYLKDVDDHVPLATVSAEIRSVGQEINQPIVERLFGIFNSEFKIVVGLMQLIPEEQVRLGRRL